jgi:hypothetical protein
MPFCSQRQGVFDATGKVSMRVCLGLSMKVLLVGLLSAAVTYASNSLAASDKSELLDKPIPMKTDEEMPKRVAPLLEIGGAFLGTGNIPSGFELPGGSVWIPQLWVYGNIRTALNAIERENASDIGDVVVQPTFNFHLKLTGTERAFLQLRPLDTPKGFTGYRFNGGKGEETQFNASLRTLFFEGDLGEMFPKLDPEDQQALDFGFSVGRQPIFFQEGMMINDTMDAVSLVRDTVIFPGLIDTRFTGLFAWNNISRNDNANDDDAALYGLFIESDTRKSTIALDVAYVESNIASGGDGLFIGASSVQRLGNYNTAVRVIQSIAMDDETAQVSDGTLFFGEFSTEPTASHDIAYLNAFVGLQAFSSAARGEQAGGPLGRTGILFANPGIGRTFAPLGSNADEAFGGAAGYQMFFNDDSTQLVAEVGGIVSEASTARVQDGYGIGLRLQQKFLNRFLFQIDSFYTNREIANDVVGARLELTVQF